MKNFLLLIATAAVVLTGCATTSQVDPQILSAASSRGVNSGTVLKMQGGQALDYQDIKDLVSRGVPSTVIVAYLNSTQKVYNFSFSQLADLKSAGATPQVLNYLSETQGFYGNNSPKQAARTSAIQKDRYYNTPSYQARQPFAYNPPIIDDWYDSAYEESLYSPFSFN